MNEKKKTKRRYPLKCPTCGGYLSFSKRTFENFTYCNSCSYDSRIENLKRQRDIAVKALLAMRHPICIEKPALRCADCSEIEVAIAKIIKEAQ